MAFRKGIFSMFVGMGLAALGFAGPSAVDEGPRSRVHFTAVRGYYSYSIPWNLDNPEAPVPLLLPPIKYAQATFLGHVKKTDQGVKDVVGGDLRVRLGPINHIFADIWKERLMEIGTVKMSSKSPEEIYFLSMEGNDFQSWHFNLFNPVTSTLITLSCSWGHDDPAAVVKKSDNFKSPELTDERELLEGLAHEPVYGVPFNRK